MSDQSAAKTYTFKHRAPFDVTITCQIPIGQKFNQEDAIALEKEIRHAVSHAVGSKIIAEVNEAYSRLTPQQEEALIAENRRWAKLRSRH